MPSGSHPLLLSVLFLGVGIAFGNMLDLIEPTKVAPTSCESGCAQWSSFNTSGNALWAAGHPPLHAANYCAQPGKAVNARPLGSWCYCKSNASKETVPGDSSEAIPNFDGKIFQL